MKRFPYRKLVPLVLAAGAVVMVLFQSRMPAGPRHAPYALLEPLSRFRGSNEAQARMTRENGELLAALLAAQAEAGALKEQLRQVSDYRGAGLPSVNRVMPATVLLAEDPSGWHRTIMIDRGSNQGVRPGMIVTEGASVVGRILEVGPETARVQLITDSAFRMKASAVLKGSQAPGVTGILAGQGDGTCQLRYVLDREPVAAGWSVLSVLDPDRRWPAGLLVGDVLETGDGPEGNYGTITVQPRLDPRRLTHVLILLEKEMP